jgi:hypothetical protein
MFSPRSNDQRSLCTVVLTPPAAATTYDVFITGGCGSGSIGTFSTQ